jgi:hypothetical protein
MNAEATADFDISTCRHCGREIFRYGYRDSDWHHASHPAFDHDPAPRLYLAARNGVEVSR